MVDGDYEDSFYCKPCKKKMVKEANPEPPIPNCDWRTCPFKSKLQLGDSDGKHYCLIHKRMAEEAAVPAAQEAEPAWRCEVLKKDKDKSVCGKPGNQVYRGVMCCAQHYVTKTNAYDKGMQTILDTMRTFELSTNDVVQVRAHLVSSHLKPPHPVSPCLQAIEEQLATQSEAGPSAAYEELELEENEEEDD